jgi:hypothetical protein
MLTRAPRDSGRDFIFATALQPSLPVTETASKMAAPQPQWLFYAISSGVCASLNGVFAKMTTTTEFDDWSHFFGMKEKSLIVEALVRGVCIQSQLEIVQTM